MNQLCRVFDTGLKVYEMNLDTPTGDITVEPAMSEEECAQAMAYGMMAVEPGIDALALGEMGIGNTTAAAGAWPATWRARSPAPLAGRGIQPVSSIAPGARPLPCLRPGQDPADGAGAP